MRLQLELAGLWVDHGFVAKPIDYFGDRCFCHLDAGEAGSL